MASTPPTEQALSAQSFVAVAALVGVAALSMISILGVFFILGVSLMQSRAGDKTVFVRTQMAKYLCSLLICNLVQACGGLLNIAWLVENRIHVGMACTTQATLKQIGNIGPAIFTFVIAVQTFCLLFLRRDWTSLTCHIIHFVAWAFLLFVLCIESFAVAKPEKGPHYGISTSGYWCWISPQYKIERYVTDYLFMAASAAFSLLLYLLVFFRLRGNISVTGYRPSFHRRPNVRIGRTSNGALIATGDGRVESPLDKVAKHMLWYPIVYVIIVFPMVATRYPAFSGFTVPFEATVTIAAFFNLHGFFNAVLFCTTRNILPESWKQGCGPRTMQGPRRGDVYQSSRRSETWSATTRPGTGSTGRPSQSVIDVEKVVEITRN